MREIKSVTGRRLLALAFAAAVLTVFAGVARAGDLDLSAKSAIVMDADTAELIVWKNPHMKLPPASTTKVMTAILAIENSKLTRKCRVSRNAARKEPSKVNLFPGDRISVEALLYSVLLKSANDAASALAEGVAGSEPAFAKMMTQRAAELGASNTNFKNASGLPEKGHYSTVYDLALIFRQACKYDIFRQIAETRYATLHFGGEKDLLIKNSNKLLWIYDGAVAGKTGYTREARDCYVGMAERNGRRLIVAVLKSEQRWQDVTQLLDKGFELADLGVTLAINDTPTCVPAGDGSRPEKVGVGSEDED